MADQIERLRAVLAAMPGGPMTIEPHGDGEAIYIDRRDPPRGEIGGGTHGLNVAHVVEPAHQWPAVRAGITALGSLWPALLAVAEAVQDLAETSECPHCSYGQATFIAHVAGVEVGAMRTDEHDDWCPLAALDAAIAAALPEAP